MSKLIDRFIKYVKYDTKSSETTGTTPSTPGQLVFAKALAAELKEIGLSNVSVDENGYVMAFLPSNISGNTKNIGFISHMDTSPDMSGKNVNPKFVENYNGDDIVLNAEKNIILSPKDFPELLKYKGETLITTDGTTLLGADDKAGVSEIVTAMEYLASHPEIPHGNISIAFTPDEEIGEGADHFNVDAFGADLAYTVDGGSLGQLEYENFNAAGFKLKVNGRNVHPGSAKDKMINSMTIASEFINALPKDEVPEKTSGYEGFYHIVGMQGEVEETTLHYIIRDFDRDNFEKRKALVKNLVNELNTKYGNGILELEMKDQYYNMLEKINEQKYIVDTAFKAMELVGVKPDVSPIRGGTDGARLSFMGLPTPNLFTGGENFHGKYEFASTNVMELSVKVILKIVELYAQK